MWVRDDYLQLRCLVNSSQSLSNSDTFVSEKYLFCELNITTMGMQKDTLLVISTLWKHCRKILRFILRLQEKKLPPQLLRTEDNLWQPMSQPQHIYSHGDCDFFFFLLLPTKRCKHFRSHAKSPSVSLSMLLSFCESISLKPTSMYAPATKECAHTKMAEKDLWACHSRTIL